MICGFSLSDKTGSGSLQTAGDFHWLLFYLHYQIWSRSSLVFVVKLKFVCYCKPFNIFFQSIPFDQHNYMKIIFKPLCFGWSQYLSHSSTFCSWWTKWSDDHLYHVCFKRSRSVSANYKMCTPTPTCSRGPHLAIFSEYKLQNTKCELQITKYKDRIVCYFYIFIHPLAPGAHTLPYSQNTNYKTKHSK